MGNKTTNKKQIAYEFLKSRIVGGDYWPGRRIIIDQVAKELKLSIIPVREAIRQLEADGLIQYKAYSGAVVSQINEEEYLETLTVLALLDGYATALSAKFITLDDITQLERINEEMHNALYAFEFEKLGRINRSFHELIYDHCGNGVLKEQIRQAWQRMDCVWEASFNLMPQRAKQSIEEHQQIIHMLKEQASLQDIEAFARQHKLKTGKTLQKQKKETSHV